MPEHVWTLCCENVITDRRTNNISLINVVERVNAAPGVGTIGTRLFLVSLWSKTKGLTGAERFRFRVRWESPEGNRTLIGSEMEQEVPEKVQRLRVLMAVGAMDIGQAGDYHFVQEVMGEAGEWQEVAHLPLEVVITDK